MRAKHLILSICYLICFILFCSPVQGAFVCLDSACVGCHVLPTSAINVALTHPKVLIGCIKCHYPECLGFHKDGIRQLDPLYYSYAGTAANIGCNVCHGAPPQALCAGIGSLIKDHCLDPAGCYPEIFNCIPCHANFNGLPSHIYPKIVGIPLFSTPASVAKCMACHGLSLLVGRSGAHTTHFLSKIIAPATTLSIVLSIDCVVCHPNLAVNLGPDHVVCIHGTSNAWLPGKVPVVFKKPLPPIGVGDFYALGPLGGTGTCVVYCHSNGQTRPTTLLTAPLGYPGSNLPLPWNVPLPVNPLTLDCGCCHGFPPITHTATKTDCNSCHPEPVLGAAPTKTYHINGIVDLWRYILSASPPVPLITSPSFTSSSSSISSNDLILGSLLGMNGFLGLPGMGLGLPGTGLGLLGTGLGLPGMGLGLLGTGLALPGMGLATPGLYGLDSTLLSALGAPNALYNPIMTAPLSMGLSAGTLGTLPLTDYLISSTSTGLPYASASSLLPGFGYGFGIPGLMGLPSPWNYTSASSFSPLLSPGFLSSGAGFGNPFFPFGSAGFPFYW